MPTDQIITCPYCGAKNRISPDRPNPLCSRCKHPLNEPAKVVHLTDATFAELAEQSPLPVLIDFWAPWCPPCRAIAPVIESLATEYSGRVRIAKIDVDQNPQSAARFNAASIPLLVVLKEGKEVDRLVGAHPATEIRRHLNGLLK